MNELVNEWMNEIVNEWMNLQMNEWTCKRMNELANNQGGVRVILEDFSEKDWSVHMGGGCEAHKGP